MLIPDWCKSSMTTMQCWREWGGATWTMKNSQRGTCRSWKPWARSLRPPKSQNSDQHLPCQMIRLASAEVDLLVEKIKGTYTYVKRKGRDSGSGVRLPPACRALLRVWRPLPSFSQGRRKMRKEAQEKKEEEKEEQDNKDGPEESPDLRSLFGLEPKKKPELVLVPDDSSSSSSRVEIPKASASSNTASGLLERTMCCDLAHGTCICPTALPSWTLAHTWTNYRKGSFP